MKHKAAQELQKLSRLAQIKKYGGLKAYKKEMKRRAKLSHATKRAKKRYLLNI